MGKNDFTAGGQGSLLEPEVVAFNWPARPEDRPSARGPVHDCQTPHIEGYRGANKGGPTPQWMVGVYEGGEVVLHSPALFYMGST